MNPQEKIDLTSNILTLGKALAPDRFPQPNPATGAAWAKALDRMFDAFPPEIWDEAVTVWAMELVTDRMITPKDLKQAVYIVRDRWETDPVKSRELEEARIARRDMRDRQIEAGTLRQFSYYGSAPELQSAPERKPSNVSQENKDRWREVIGKFKTGEAQ